MLSVALTEHHAMKAYWGSGGTSHILHLSIKWIRVVSFMPQPLYLRERAPGIHWIGGWVGPRAGIVSLKIIDGRFCNPM